MLNIACIQMRSKLMEVKKNIKKANYFIHLAKKEKANLVVFPELFNLGYNFKIYKNIYDDFIETKSFLSHIAKELDIFIAAGILEIENDNFYNSIFVFNNEGKIITKYRKINLFPLSYEIKIFKPGNSISTFSIGDLKFGLMICFDIRFPELSRKYLKENCTGIIISSAFPFPRLDHWRTLLKSRAIENQMYIIAANQIGGDGLYNFLGNSCIIDPWGTMKAIANETEETIVMYKIENESVEKVRKNIPCLQNFNRLTIILK